MSVQYSTGTELEHRVYGMAYVSIHNLLPVQWFPWDPPHVPAYLQYPICTSHASYFVLQAETQAKVKTQDGGVIPKPIITINGIFLT